MADPEVDWGVDDDFDPWAHPEPESGRTGQAIGNSKVVDGGGVGGVSSDSVPQNVPSGDRVNGTATPEMELDPLTSALHLDTWITLSSRSQPNQPYYVNLSTLQTSWATPPSSSNEQIYDLSGITTPPPLSAPTSEPRSNKKIKRGTKEDGKDTRPLIERLAPLPAVFRTQNEHRVEDDQKEVKEQRAEKAENEVTPSQSSPATVTAVPPAVASTSTAAPEPPRTDHISKAIDTNPIAPATASTVARTVPPIGPKIPIRERITLQDSYRPDSLSSTRGVVVKGDFYRPDTAGNDRERGRDSEREGFRDQPGWYGRSRSTERPYPNRRNSRSRSVETRERSRLDERDRRDGNVERFRDRPQHDLRSQPVGVASSNASIKEDNVIARDRRGQPLVTRRSDAPPAPSSNNVPNRVGIDRPPHLDRPPGGVQNRMSPSMPITARSHLGQPSFPVAGGYGRPPSRPSMGGYHSQHAISNRLEPRDMQGPSNPNDNYANAPPASAGMPRATRWTMDDSSAPRSAITAPPGRATFGASAVPPMRDVVEKRRGDDMARGDSVKRPRMVDGSREEPRTERQWGARKDDNLSPSMPLTASTEPPAVRTRAIAAEQRQPAGHSSAGPARAVFVHPSRQTIVSPSEQGGPPSRRDDLHTPSGPRGPAHNYQQSAPHPSQFSAPRRGGPPLYNSGRGQNIAGSSSNAVPVAPRDTRGRAG